MIDILIKKKRQTFFDASFFVIVVEVRAIGKETKRRMTKLVLIRHGQSLANQENEYTGWSDSPLTAQGIREAKIAGEKLRQTGIVFEHVHTSVLQRAIKTADIVLAELGQEYLPLIKTWRLNERHYGALRGLNKDYTRKLYGKKQVALWRRSFEAVPPLLEKPQSDRRYQKYPKTIVPRAESLKQASARIIPYWVDQVAPKVLQVANAAPIIYELDEKLQIISKTTL